MNILLDPFNFSVEFVDGVPFGYPSTTDAPCNYYECTQDESHPNVPVCTKYDSILDTVVTVPFNCEICDCPDFGVFPFLEWPPTLKTKDPEKCDKSKENYYNELPPFTPGSKTAREEQDDWKPEDFTAFYIVGKLQSYGWSYHAAIAAVANLKVESPSLNPGQYQNAGGPGRGLAQWELGGRFDGWKRWSDYNIYLERQKNSAFEVERYSFQLDENGNKEKTGEYNLVDFARSRGKDWDDLDVQIEFIDFEHRYGRDKFKEAFQEYENVPGADDCEKALAATKIFVKKYEGASKPHLDRRYKAAEKYCKQFENFKDLECDPSRLDKKMNKVPGGRTYP